MCVECPSVENVLLFLFSRWESWSEKKQKALLKVFEAVNDTVRPPYYIIRKIIMFTSSDVIINQ